MSLDKEKLKKTLEDKIKKIEPDLVKALESKTDGLYKVQETLDKIFAENIPSKNFNVDIYKQKLWETTANEWAKSLAKQLLIVLSKELSIIISDEMTQYIKSAQINIPAGQVVQVNTGTGTGATTTLSPDGTIN